MKLTAVSKRRGLSSLEPAWIWLREAVEERIYDRICGLAHGELARKEYRTSRMVSRRICDTVWAQLAEGPLGREET